MSRHVVDRPVASPVASLPWWPAALAGLGGLAWPAVALAAEGGGGGLIQLNASLAVQLVSFLLLLAVLYRFAYRPLLATLEARTATIKQQLAEAQAAREAAQRQLAEFEARLTAAQAEAQTVRERALRDAAEMRERLAAEARQEAARLVETARAEIDQDVRRARGELRREVVGLAVAIAERLIQRNVQAEDQDRLVQDALARLGSR
jgi:F-type H+-transporting ATPase subunit b